MIKVRVVHQNEISSRDYLINQRGVEWGEIAAIGSVVILPILILVFLVQKHIVRGLTLGAVKG